MLCSCCLATPWCATARPPGCLFLSLLSPWCLMLTISSVRLWESPGWCLSTKWPGSCANIKPTASVSAGAAASLAVTVGWNVRHNVTVTTIRSVETLDFFMTIFYHISPFGIQRYTPHASVSLHNSGYAFIFYWRVKISNISYSRGLWDTIWQMLSILEIFTWITFCWGGNRSLLDKFSEILK